MPRVKTRALYRSLLFEWLLTMIDKITNSTKSKQVQIRSLYLLVDIISGLVSACLVPLMVSVTGAFPVGCFCTDYGHYRLIQRSLARFRTLQARTSYTKHVLIASVCSYIRDSVHSINSSSYLTPLVFVSIFV